MSESVELWIVRHGETEWSASGKHTSRTDIPLTDQGRARAKKLGEYLKSTRFDAVFVSPMQRARETCDIAGFGKQAIVDDQLKEWDYGIYEGKTTPEIRNEIPGWSVWKDPIIDAILGSRPQDGQGLSRERRTMYLARLHSGARNRPDCCLKVDL